VSSLNALVLLAGGGQKTLDMEQSRSGASPVCDQKAHLSVPRGGLATFSIQNDASQPSVLYTLDDRRQQILLGLPLSTIAGAAYCLASMSMVRCTACNLSV
jgi:hypothetical protein